ncbi:MAG TPA: hypothetical protein VLA89_06940 [Gemmatimonadales bacterium]|nr:hypothetical protein [Gemmatimonadales bacterium]
MKKLIALVLSLLAVLALAGCASDADVVSANISKDADFFRVPRRVVFYNGITDSYMLTIEGYCSLGNSDAAGQLTVTCKVGPGDQYKKHFLGLSDNVTYFVEQLDPATVNPDHYKVVFKPSVIVPDIEVK